VLQDLQERSRVNAITKKTGGRPSTEWSLIRAKSA